MNIDEHGLIGVKPTHISEAEVILKREVPGITLMRHNHRPGVILGYRIELHVMDDIAINAEAANMRMQIAAEQVRARAMADLGLNPIMEGLKAEARKQWEIANSMSSLAMMRASEIDRLKAQIAELEEQIDARNDDLPDPELPEDESKGFWD